MVETPTINWDKKVPEQASAPALPASSIKIAKTETNAEMLEKCKIPNWTETGHETIMIFGPPKVGKTMAYMPIIEETIKNKGHIWIINTDDGVVRTLKAYFTPEQQEAIRANTTFYYLGRLEYIFAIIPDIIKNVKPNDLLVIDLVSEFWEMAQAKFIEDSSGGDPINFIIQAEKDKKTFGLFDGVKWQYIKRLEGFIRKELIVRPHCNVIGVSSEKDIDVEKAMSKKTTHKYDVTGMKPGGSKELTYDFNTLIYLGIQPTGKRFFQIVGDRGTNIDPSTRFEFDKDFYTKFKEVVKR